MSFEAPEYTANSDALGTLRILEAIRLLGLQEKTRIYQASTSELYGMVQETPQRETTPFIREVPMASQNSTPIGLPLIIERRMAFMLAMEFYSIMKVLFGAKLLLQEKSLELLLE